MIYSHIHKDKKNDGCQGWKKKRTGVFNVCLMYMKFVVQDEKSSGQ